MGSEYYCEKCDLVVSWTERKVNKFCPKCGTFLRPKIIRERILPRSAKSIVQEIEPIELTRDDINVHTLFQEFHNLKNYTCVEAIVFDDTESWLEERRSAYKEFRERFKSSLYSPDETKNVFHDFLYFRNNKSWTTLYRTGTAALQNQEGLSRLIVSLLDDSMDIRSRIDSALTGRLHINGVGRNIATAVVHVCDTEDRYGVWNSRTEETLQLLKRAPTHASTPHIVAIFFSY